MNRFHIHWSMAVAFFLLVMSGAMAVLAANQSPNILTNGGFEILTDSGVMPLGWNKTRVQHTLELVTFAVDEGVAHTGEQSLSLAIAEGHPDDVIDHNWNTAIKGFEPGATYDFVGWVRSSDLPGTAFIVLQCWDLGMKEMIGFASTHPKNQISGTEDWKPFKTSITVPEATGHFRILAGIRGPDNRGGKVWFDDFSLRKRNAGE